MTRLSCAGLHEHLVKALAELSWPMKLLREDEVFNEDGVPSQYSGISQLLEVDLDMLLALRPGPLRDKALRKVQLNFSGMALPAARAQVAHIVGAGFGSKSRIAP